MHGIGHIIQMRKYNVRVGDEPMSCTTFCELKRKEVINICDGARLGCICDLELDDESGVISAIIVPGPGKLWGLLRSDEELVIPYNRIKKIGDDVILVDILP